MSKPMIKQILIPLILILTISPLKSQSNYQLVYQPRLSTMMGTEIIATANYMFLEVESKYLKPRLFQKPNKKIRNGILNGFYRLGKTIIFDVTRDNFLTVFQHEVFGHGARLREYGFTKNRFYVGFPNGGGTAWYGIAPENRIKSLEEEIMIRLGGNESTMLLSSKIRNNWVQSGTIDIREAFLYARSFIGTSAYIRNTDVETATPSNDIYSYYKRVNQLNNVDLDETPFTIDYLKKRALINYLNPLQYYAIYTLVKDYIILGKEEVRLPMIPIGRFQYLPLIRMGFTPFGTEMYIENFIRTDKSLNTIYLRIGDGIFHDFYGLGLKKTNILLKNRLKIDGEFDVWKQPKMDLGGETIQSVKAGVGAAVKLGLGIKLFDSPNASWFYGVFGYKSPGYLEGEFLKEGFFSRIGLMLIK